MMRTYVTLQALAVLTITSIAAANAFSAEIPFTQEDRDRLIRLETKLEGWHRSLQKQIDDQGASLQRQIDDLKTPLLWGFGILLGGMGLLIGFVIWDRRTALSPALRKYQELEERWERIERALKEMARKNAEIAEVLKSVGLL